MKRLILIIVMVALMAISTGGGYMVASQSNQQAIKDSYSNGYLSGKSTGYKVGQDSILSEMPKDVSYAEVVEFVAKDKTNEHEYDKVVFNCEDFSRIVRENANKAGIRCGYVELTLIGGSHAVNVFNVTNGYSVYLEAQNDVLMPSVYGEIGVGKNYIDALNTMGWVGGKGFVNISGIEGNGWIIKKMNTIW